MDIVQSIVDFVGEKRPSKVGFSGFLAAFNLVLDFSCFQTKYWAKRHNYWVYSMVTSDVGTVQLE